MSEFVDGRRLESYDETGDPDEGYPDLDFLDPEVAFDGYLDIEEVYPGAIIQDPTAREAAARLSDILDTLSLMVDEEDPRLAALGYISLALEVIVRRTRKLDDPQNDFIDPLLLGALDEDRLGYFDDQLHEAYIAISRKLDGQGVQFDPAKDTISSFLLPYIFGALNRYSLNQPSIATGSWATYGRAGSTLSNQYKQCLINPDDSVADRVKSFFFSSEVSDDFDFTLLDGEEPSDEMLKNFASFEDVLMNPFGIPIDEIDEEVFAILDPEMETADARLLLSQIVDAAWPLREKELLTIGAYFGDFELTLNKIGVFLLGGVSRTAARQQKERGLSRLRSSAKRLGLDE